MLRRNVNQQRLPYSCVRERFDSARSVFKGALAVRGNPHYYAATTQGLDPAKTGGILPSEREEMHCRGYRDNRDHDNEIYPFPILHGLDRTVLLNELPVVFMPHCFSRRGGSKRR